MMRRAAIAAASLALALGACGGGDEPPAPATRSPAPTATRAATPAAPPARRVRFRASDGKPVKGVYRPAGAAAPAVVLVNGLVGGTGQWDAFTPYLHDAGFATLAYDGRGGVDEAELVKEVGGAVAFLRRRRDVDARRLGIVGVERRRLDRRARDDRAQPPAAARRRRPFPARRAGVRRADGEATATTRATCCS